MIESLDAHDLRFKLVFVFVHVPEELELGG
jgi:hypothetical protein